MKKPEHFDVIIIGGSYSGLAAALALGRALRKVLIIDGGQPCDAQIPYSHNFLTQALTLFTNGPSVLTDEQPEKLQAHYIRINDRTFDKLVHDNGQLQHIQFKDQTISLIKAPYAPGRLNNIASSLKPWAAHLHRKAIRN